MNFEFGVSDSEFMSLDSEMRTMVGVHGNCRRGNDGGSLNLGISGGRGHPHPLKGRPAAMPAGKIRASGLNWRVLPCMLGMRKLSNDAPTPTK